MQTMKVGELIAELKKMPKKALVIIDIENENENHKACEVCFSKNPVSGYEDLVIIRDYKLGGE